MPLDKPSLKAGIQALHSELYINSGNLTPVQAGERYATALSDLIEVFVKSAQLNVQGAGLVAGATPVSGLSTTGFIL